MQCIKEKYLAHCIYLVVRICTSHKDDFVRISMQTVSQVEWRGYTALTTKRHISFIYLWGNGNINSIITSIKITGQAAQMIKCQDKHSTVIYLEYVLWCMYCKNYQVFFSGGELLHTPTPFDRRDSLLTMSEASPKNAMDNDDNWLGRFSTLAHNHKNVSLTWQSSFF